MRLPGTAGQWRYVHRDQLITSFARTNARLPYRSVGIKGGDRLSHVYVIGKTGVGKTTLLDTMIRQDIAAGHGCALIDPHGDFVERVAASVPVSRKGDVTYLNVTDPAQASWPWLRL